jgi:uncharacterized protein YjdB
MTPASTRLRSTARRLAAVPILLAFAACSSGGSGASQSTRLVSSAVKSFAIVPNTASVPAGTKLPFAARAVFADGTIRDVSAESTWSSSDPSLVTFIPGVGVAVATAIGTATVTATYQGVPASASLEITSGLVLRMAVNPASATIARGTKLQLAVFAALSDSKQDVTKVATWRSSNAAAATVDGAGLVTGVGAGAATITAEFGGAIVLARITVTNATLQSISIGGAASGGASTALGVDLPLSASGGFSDGNTQDLTTLVTWTSSDPSVATVGSDGVVHPVGPGTTVITASRDGATGSVAVTVANATLVSMAITPASKTLVVGNVAAFRATGTFTDGSAHDLTAQVSWASSNDVVVTVAADGTATAKAAGNATIAAAVADGSISATASVTVRSARLVSIAITPATTTLAAGLTAQLAATGTYDDGTAQPLTGVVAWTSSSAAVASVSNATGTAGVVSATAPGTATITASLAGISANANVTVSTAALRSIAVSGPPSIAAGTSGAFTATGTYSDGSSKDVSSLVAWSSSDQGVVTVGSSGSATGLAVGTADVVARLGDVSGSASLDVTGATVQALAVTPASKTLAAGEQQRFAATATLSDGSTQIVTAQVSWTTSDAATATITSAGLLTAKAKGSATVTATLLGRSGAASVTVTGASLVGVAVSGPSTIPLGVSATYKATGTYSDGTSKDVTSLLAWSSGSGIAMSGPVATGVAAGRSQVRAANADGTVAGGMDVDVTAAVLQSVQVYAATTNLVVGTSTRLTATGVYSDHGTPDVSAQADWTCSGAAATVTKDASGNVTLTANAASPSPVTVTATFGGVSGSVDVTLSVATLAQLQITPPDASSPVGLPVQLTATGVYTSGGQPVATQDLTAEVVWASSDPRIATVTNGPQGGVVTGSAVGRVTITATLGGQASGAATFTVTDAILQALEIQGAMKIATGTQTALQLMGYYSDAQNTGAPMTDVSWSSSDGAVAAIDPITGVVTGKTKGTVLITAQLNACPDRPSPCADTMPLEVANGTLTAMSVDVAPSTVLPVGLKFAAQAEQTFAGPDGSTWTQDVTPFASWTSSNPAVAQLDPTSGDPVVLRALAAGTSTLTATYLDAAADVQVTVIDATLTSIGLAAGTTTLVAEAPGLVPVGYGVQVTATATYTTSDGRTHAYDVTADALWSSSRPSCATVSNAAGTKGLVTGVAPGSVTVTATLSGVSGNVQLEVVSGKLDDLTVTGSPDVSHLTAPPQPIGSLDAIGVGDEKSLYAIGTFSDPSGRTFYVEMTNQCTWRASPRSIVWVTNSLTSAAVKNGPAKGIVTGTSDGSAKIVARKGNVSGSATATVR